MKTFVCLLTMVTVFLRVQNRRQTEDVRFEDDRESSMAEEMLKDFCRN